MTGALSESTDSHRIVETSSWRMTVPPSVDATSPLVVIPTVHPRGDRRIVRCAQVALDAGFRVHMIWLGEGDDQSTDAATGETLLPAPRHALERISRVRRIRRLAQELDGSLWHIHDFYFLGQAKRWRKRSGRPVLYDVHEYYADYYSEKLPVPALLQRLAARLLERYQVAAAGRLGAANVVAEQMAIPFRRRGVPVAVSPNYPLVSQFGGLPSVPFRERRWRVLHVGTMSTTYGTEMLIAMVQRSAERGLPFEFSAVARFPSPDHRRSFEAMLAAAGDPANLRLEPARPTHEMPALLATAGFGLSLIAPSHQNEAAIASKSFEYVISGLVNVVSDRRAQREFAQEHAVAVTAAGDDIDALLDQMMAMASQPEATEAALALRADAARERFTWEFAVAPGLSAMLLALHAEER